jgi:phage gp29-like protein
VPSAFVDKIRRFLKGGQPVPMARAAQPAPEPKPFQQDYLWDKPRLRSAPQRGHYRDLPIISGQSGIDDVASVRATLSAMASGQFEAAGRLCDELLGDDRIGALLETRIEALASLPIEITPSLRAGRKKKAQKIADRVQTEWPTWFSDAEVKKLHEWGLNLGFGIGELLWDTSELGYWAPRLKTWDLRYCYWRWDTRSFWLVTMDGPVEVRPGDGRWVIYAPHGYARCWMRGLIRPFALQYMTRRWTQRDWARWCEVHGLPIKIGVVPADADTASKESFINDLLFIGGEAVLRAERDQNGQGYDVKLVEAASQSWQGFQKYLEKVDENLAVRVLGQTLTTSAKAGGSYALGAVHDRVRIERTESDARSLGACLTEQAVLPWTFYNYGDPLLTPGATWSTRPPEDRAASAKTFLDAGNALKTLRQGGLNVDREKFAKQFRIPLIEGNPLVEPNEDESAGEGSEREEIANSTGALQKAPKAGKEESDAEEQGAEDLRAG